MSVRRRVLIIGLDGATWSVLGPLGDRGVMPFLRSLVDGGWSGPLASVVPPITPAAWSSFLTGVNPGKHGVVGFRSFDRARHRFGLVSSGSIRRPTLWEHLSAHGRSVVAINVPMSYPPRPVNGVVVSDFLTPSTKVDYTYPASVKLEFERELGGYRILNGTLSKRLGHGLDIVGYLREMRLANASRSDAARYLLRTRDWDAFMVHFQSVDQVQHYLWAHLDPTDPAFDQRQHELITTAFFADLDERLRAIVAEAQRIAGDDLLVLVISDHGFQARRTDVRLSQWLREHGYLRVRRRLVPAALGALHRLDVLRLRYRVLSHGRRGQLFNAAHGLAIDWPHTAAIHGDGNTPWGVIYLLDANDEATREALVRDLWTLRDNGRPVVERVALAAEVFAGPYLPEMPDVLVQLRDGYSINSTFAPGPVIERVPRSLGRVVGHHHPDGIVVASGPVVRRGAGRAALWDIAPTVLWYLGAPIPGDSDGRPLDEVLALDSDPRYEAPAAADGQVARGISADEEAEIQQRLRELGYL